MVQWKNMHLSLAFRFHDSLSVFPTCWWVDIPLFSVGINTNLKFSLSAPNNESSYKKVCVSDNYNNEFYYSGYKHGLLCHDWNRAYLNHLERVWVNIVVMSDLIVSIRCGRPSHPIIQGL